MAVDNQRRAIWIIPFAFLLSSTWLSCHDGGVQNVTAPEGPAEALVLSNLVVSLDRVVGFGPFGESLGGTRQSPAWTIITSDPLASVFAVSPGVVEQIEVNDPARSDREVHPSQLSRRDDAGDSDGHQRGHRRSPPSLARPLRPVSLCPLRGVTHWSGVTCVRLL